MAPKSLFELCTVVCLKHIKEITDIGLTPYPAVRRILLNVNSAAQLRQLELASPHLEGDDAECWIRLIEKDFPVLSKKHDFEPKNPTFWHKVYSKYQRLEEEQKQAATEKLKSAFGAIKQEKASKVSSIVAYDRRKLPSLPKDGPGTAGVRRVKGQPVASTNGLRFTGGTKTKVTDAKSIMRKARREAAAIGARNRLDTQTASLRRDQLHAAPKGMVNEHKLKQQPVARGMPSAGGRMRIPRPPVTMSKRIDQELEEREARLRKMTSQAHGKKNTTVVSDDELEDEEDIGYQYEDEGGYESGGGGGGGGMLDVDDLEDIFDEKPQQPSLSSRSSSSRPVLSSSSSSAFKKTGVLASKSGSGSRPKPASSSSSAFRSDNVPSPRSGDHSPANPTPTSAAGKPPPPKRKAPVDVFMKKKPRVAR